MKTNAIENNHEASLPKKLMQSNALTNASYSLTVYQKRFIYLIIAQVRRLYIETNEGNKTLFQNLYLTISPDVIKECGNASVVFKEAVNLRSKTYIINREDEKVAVGWINYVKRNKKSGNYEVEVSKELLPEIVALSEKYTAYQLVVALTLKSVYSQRLYELCSQYKNYNNGYFIKTVEEMKFMFQLPESYNNYGLLKSRVLLQAQSELKELYDEEFSDIYFQFREKDKERKKVKSVEFYVVTREREKERAFDIDDAIYFIRTNLNPLFKKDKEYVNRIVNELRLKPEIAFQVVQKINEKIKKYSVKDLPAIIRFVLDEDFSIK
jgi:plasmid replication initiation protein